MRKIIITCLMATMIFVGNIYAADTPLTDKIDKAVTNHDEYIDLSNEQLTSEELVKIMTAYFGLYPSAGLINCGFKAYDENEDGLYDVIVPEYRYSEQMSRIINRQNDRAENKIISQAAGLTPEEQVKFVYAYFCKKFVYDNELNYDLKHLYTENSGTCASFSIAFKNIMDKLDIPCKIIISEDMTHEWNQVFINNEWRSIDITEGIRLYGTGYVGAYWRAYLTSEK